MSKGIAIFIFLTLALALPARELAQEPARAEATPVEAPVEAPRGNANPAQEPSSWSPEQLLRLGYQAYQQRHWLKVVAYLGEAALSFPDNDLLYLYLGTAHQILGEDSLAERTLLRGVNLQGKNMQKIAFVLGNYYYSMGRYNEAVDAYNLATWGEEQLVQAFLNRANLYLSYGFYSNALNDYTYFLFRKPFDPQRKKIETVIEKLTALGVQGRIQADGGVIAGDYLQQDPGGNGLAGDGENADRLATTQAAGANETLGDGNPDSASRAYDDGFSSAETALPDDNSLGKRYSRPAGDSGNTVGTGGDTEAQRQQLNQGRRSLRQLNQNAIILSRERPNIIEQTEKFSDIDE